MRVQLNELDTTGDSEIDQAIEKVFEPNARDVFLTARIEDNAPDDEEHADDDEEEDEDDISTTSTVVTEPSRQKTTTTTPASKKKKTMPTTAQEQQNQHDDEEDVVLVDTDTIGYGTVNRELPQAENSVSESECFD